MIAVACLVAVAALAWWGALALHHRALHRHAGEQARKEATRAGWRALDHERWLAAEDDIAAMLRRCA